MKYLIMALILLTGFVLYSCKDSLGLDDVLIKDKTNLFFPQQIGYYWVYENNSNGVISIDSVVISGTEVVEGQSAYKYTIFRDGVYKSDAYFTTDANSVFLYAEMYEPLIDTFYCYCNYNWSLSWKKIAKFSEPWSETKVNDNNDDSLVSMVFDPDIQDYVLVSSKITNTLNFEGTPSGEDTLQLGADSYPSTTYSFNTHWYCSLDSISQPNLKYFKDDELRYGSDYLLIYEEIRTKLWFSEDVGIVKTEADIINSKGVIYTHSRSLLRHGTIPN
jgi:hypothetical protein